MTELCGADLLGPIQLQLDMVNKLAPMHLQRRPTADCMFKSEEEEDDGNQPKMSEVTYEPSVAASLGAAPSAISAAEDSDLSVAPDVQEVTPLPVPSEKMSPRERSRSPYK